MPFGPRTSSPDGGRRSSTFGPGAVSPGGTRRGSSFGPSAPTTRHGRVDYAAREDEIARILAEQDPGWTFSGYAENFGKDLWEMIKGIPALAKAGLESQKDLYVEAPLRLVRGQPLKPFSESIPYQMGKGMYEFYKEAASDPAKYFYEHPASFWTDVATVASGGSGAVTKVGQLGKAAQLSKAAQAAKAAKAGTLGEVAHLAAATGTKPYKAFDWMSKAKDPLLPRIAKPYQDLQKELQLAKDTRSNIVKQREQAIDKATRDVVKGKVDKDLAAHIQDSIDPKWITEEARLSEKIDMLELQLGSSSMAVRRDLANFIDKQDIKKLKRDVDAWMFRERVKEGKKMGKAFGLGRKQKPLTMPEMEKLVDFMKDQNALINPEKVAWFNSDPRYRKAWEYMDQRARETAKFDVEAGRYGPETPEIRKWSPAVFERLEKEGLTNPQFVKLVDMQAERLMAKGVVDDMTLAKQAIEGALPAHITTQHPITHRMFKSISDSDPKLGYDMIKVVKDTLQKEIRHDPANLVYFPHITGAGDPFRFTRFFTQSKLPKTQKAKSSLKYTGAKDFDVNLEKAWATRNAEHFKMQADAKLIQELKKKGKPFNGDPATLLPGHVIFAPDTSTMIRKLQFRVNDRMLKKAASADEAAKKSMLEKAFPDTETAMAMSEELSRLLKQQKDIYLKDPAPMYQLPMQVKRAYETRIGSIFGPNWKVFWDTPMNAWRASVLALSPRWIMYNMLGNTVLNMLGGVTPFSKGYRMAIKGTAHDIKNFITGRDRPRKEVWRDLVPEEVGMGQVAMESYVAKPGGAYYESFPVKALEDFKQTKFFKTLKAPVDFMLGVNGALETFFRQAHYLDKATKMARAELLAEGMIKKGIADKATAGLYGTKISDDLLRTKLKSFLDDPAKSKKAVDSVNEFLFDYSNLGPMERGIVRRFISPFYAWHKNITRLTLSLPVKYPGRAQLLKNLGIIGYDELMDMYEEYGIDVKTMPDWMVGAVPIGVDAEKGEIIMWNPRGANPMSTVPELFETKGVSSMAPPWKFLIERYMGYDLFRQKPFDTPSAIQVGYRQIKYDPKTGEFKQTKVVPSIPRHLALQFPQFTLVEDLLKPYQKYSTGEPKFDYKGRLREKKRVPTALKYIGMPTLRYTIPTEDTLKYREQAKKASITKTLKQLQRQQEFKEQQR